MSDCRDNDKSEKVYLFTGEADARRREAVEELIGRFVDSSFTDFDLELIDAEASSAPHILAAASTVPFASERKVVVVERVDLLSPDDQLKIAQFLPKLSERSCLILLTSENARMAKSKSRAKGKASEGAEGEEEAPKKGLQPKLRSAANKHGTLVVHEKLKPKGLLSLVAAEARRHGKEIEERAATALAYSVEANLSLMQREMEKLAVYTEGRKTITLADVEHVTPRPAEDRIFPMMDAIGARRPAQAVRLLRETFDASARPEDEVMRILAMLARHFRLLLQMAYLKQAGVNPFGQVPDEVREMLPKDHNLLEMADFARRAMAAQARYFTLPQISACLKQVLACELATKGIEGEASSRRLNLEMLVMKLCERR